MPAGSRFRPPCAASPKGLRYGNLSCSAWGRRPSGTSRCRDIAVDTPTPDVLMPSSRPPPRPRHGHHFIVLELLICPSLHLDLVDASGIFILFLSGVSVKASKDLRFYWGGKFEFRSKIHLSQTCMSGTEQKLQDNKVVTYHVVNVVRDGSMA